MPSLLAVVTIVLTLSYSTYLVDCKHDKTGRVAVSENTVPDPTNDDLQYTVYPAQTPFEGEKTGEPYAIPLFIPVRPTETVQVQTKETARPTSKPFQTDVKPTLKPIQTKETARPSTKPIQTKETAKPSYKPSQIKITAKPTIEKTAKPTVTKTFKPTIERTAKPVLEKTARPSSEPTKKPVKPIDGGLPPVYFKTRAPTPVFKPLPVGWDEALSIEGAVSRVIDEGNGITKETARPSSSPIHTHESAAPFQPTGTGVGVDIGAEVLIDIGIGMTRTARPSSSPTRTDIKPTLKPIEMHEPFTVSDEKPTLGPIEIKETERPFTAPTQSDVKPTLKPVEMNEPFTAPTQSDVKPTLKPVEMHEPFTAQIGRAHV